MADSAGQRSKSKVIASLVAWWLCPTKQSFWPLSRLRAKLPYFIRPALCCNRSGLGNLG